MNFLTILILLLAIFEMKRVSSLPTWSFGGGTNAVVNVYPSGSLDSTDCFVSSCDHDVSIVQDAVPVFGPCGSFSYQGPIISYEGGEAILFVDALANATYSKLCQIELHDSFNTPAWSNFTQLLSSTVVVNWIEGGTSADVQSRVCACSGGFLPTTILNFITNDLCNSSCKTPIIELPPSPSPSPSFSPSPSPFPSPSPTPTPTPTPLNGACPTPQAVQTCLESTVFDIPQCQNLDDCGCLSLLVAQKGVNCVNASKCFCNQIIDFTPLPFCQSGSFLCQACANFRWPDDCSPASSLWLSPLFLVALLVSFWMA